MTYLDEESTVKLSQSKPHIRFNGQVLFWGGWLLCTEARRIYRCSQVSQGQGQCQGQRPTGRHGMCYLEELVNVKVHTKCTLQHLRHGRILTPDTFSHQPPKTIIL